MAKVQSHGGPSLTDQGPTKQDPDSENPTEVDLSKKRNKWSKVRD